MLKTGRTTEFIATGTHLLYPQRLCSGQIAIHCQMTIPRKPWELDATARRRRVHSYLIQAASLAPTKGEKGACLEFLMEQQDWGEAPTNRWPVPDAAEPNNDHQVSPTQPMPPTWHFHRNHHRPSTQVEQRHNRSPHKFDTPITRWHGAAQHT